MVGNTFDVSNIAVQRFEQECRQRFAAAEVNFQRLITYQQTGRHVAGLTSNERKQVLRLAANFHWDEEKNILYYKRNREVVRNMEKVTSVMEHNHINAVGGHSGWNATWEKVSHVYYWKNMAKDIQYYIATCTTCQRFTPLKRTLLKCSPSVLRSLWSWLELMRLDYPGPLSLCDEGYKYLCTFVDFYTKFADFFSIRDNSACGVDKCIRSFIHRWGKPGRMLSDQGRELFGSSL